jgi:Tfp pilus assembly protein PilW
MRVDNQDETAMTERGLVLLEWLVASAIVLLVAGTVFTVLTPVRDVMDRVQHHTDLTSGVRSALEVMLSDMRDAGAGASVSDADSQLADLVPSLQLTASLDSAAPVQPAGAVTVRRVPWLAAQGALASAANAGDVVLHLTTSSRCASALPACGFTPGDRAVLYTAFAAELVDVTQVLTASVSLANPLSGAFPAGATLCRLENTRYGLRPGADGDRLVRITDGGAEQPVLDGVVRFELRTDSPLAAQSRRLTLLLRVQAAAASLRGPVGVLFARGGTASSSRRWLPDMELRAAVFLRNGGAAW